MAERPQPSHRFLELCQRILPRVIHLTTSRLSFRDLLCCYPYTLSMVYDLLQPFMGYLGHSTPPAITYIIQNRGNLKAWHITWILSSYLLLACFDPTATIFTKIVSTFLKIIDHAYIYFVVNAIHVLSECPKLSFNYPFTTAGAVTILGCSHAATFFSFFGLWKRTRRLGFGPFIAQSTTPCISVSTFIKHASLL
jgi:hypothetical protein